MTSRMEQAGENGVCDFLRVPHIKFYYMPLCILLSGFKTVVLLRKLVAIYLFVHRIFFFLNYYFGCIMCLFGFAVLGEIRASDPSLLILMWL